MILNPIEIVNFIKFIRKSKMKVAYTFTVLLICLLLAQTQISSTNKPFNYLVNGDFTNITCEIHTVCHFNSSQSS